MIDSKPKVVIIGSFSDHQAILAEIERLSKIYDVIMPSKEWFERINKLMGTCSGKLEDERVLALKRIHMDVYFNAIKQANLIHVYNVKNGKEYYGINTLLEIGYALACGKLLSSKIKPTESEFRHLITIQM